MISTAGYYCDRGHVWETTTSTQGHEETQNSPCLYCMLAMKNEGETLMIGAPRGPFSSEDAARQVMEFRKSERAGR